MYNVYHFFEFLINVRSELSSVAKLRDYHFNSVPLAYRANSNFPSLILRMHKGYSWPGGEFVEIIDSDSYNVPPFESHIPTGAMSFDMLGHDRKAKIFKSMQAAGQGNRFKFEIIVAIRKNHQEQHDSVSVSSCP